MSRNNLPDSKESVAGLGTATPKYVGITLNYSPKYVFKVGKTSIPWGGLTPDQQRDIFVKHIDEVYKHHFISISYVFEMTKESNLHCHAIGKISINPDHADYHLTMIRKLVGQHPIVLKYTKGKLHYIITSNYIHYVERDKWTEYMAKDQKKLPYKKQTILAYL